MKTFEELRYSALLRGRDFCNENEEELNTIDEYAALKALLDADILKIETARAINMADISSYAAVKAQTQMYMVDLVYMYELRGAVKANAINNPGLELELSKPKTYMTTEDDAGVGVKAEEIKNILKTNKGVLTNIKDVDITLMESAILAYNEILAAPKEAIDHRKSYGTERIKGLLDEADIPKANIGKLIHSYFPDLVPGWDQAIKVGKSSGVRHTSILMKCTDKETGVVVSKIKATISKGEETIVKYSSALGYIRVYSLATGNWSMICEHPEYITQTFENIGVDDEHIAKFEVAFILKG